MHPFIHIGGIQLPVYGLMSLLGVGAAALYLWRANRRAGEQALPPDEIVNVVAIMGVGALVGAKQLYIVTMLPALIRNWSSLPSMPAALLSLVSSGGVFYGGLLGALAAAALYCRRFRQDWRPLAALFAPALPLFHAFGRIGCFFSGCCWGVPVSWGVVYRDSIGAPNGVALFPVQLLEAAINAALFAVLAVLAKKLKNPWHVMPIYLASYAVCRFGLEFLRGDTIRGVYLLSTSQWISLLILSGLLITWLVAKRRRRNV